MRYWVVVLIGALLLSGCASKKGSSGSSGSRYSIEHDHGPDRVIDMSHVPDAVPRVEPISRGGNKSPYTVLGKTYSVMSSANGYRERGGASWYGKKFHGHLTSNGEIYDMYQMTAAHKSLPLPTFARVTNLANGKQVIVRVNDRGPFHPGRIIDLSYAAAFRLGMLGAGTAHVEVEAINPLTWNTRTAVHRAPAPVPTPAPVAQRSSREAGVLSNQFVQAGAFSSAVSAQQLAAKLSGYTRQTARVERSGTLYKVLVGPVGLRSEADDIIRILAQQGISGAHLVTWPQP